jgi:hypothetical protein
MVMKSHGGRRSVSNRVLRPDRYGLKRINRWVEHRPRRTLLYLLGTVRGVVDVEDLIQDVAIRQRSICCEIRPLSATRSQTSSVRRGMSSYYTDRDHEW